MDAQYKIKERRKTSYREANYSAERSSIATRQPSAAETLIRRATMAIKIIGIDCPPGEPRPGDLLPNVITGTGLKNKRPAVKWFGAWQWEYRISEKKWKSIEPIIVSRLRDLYSEKVIRGAIWGNPRT